MPPAIDFAIPSPITGPISVGRLASVAAGAYTEIVQVIAPSNASAGKPVTVDVTVKNLHNINIYIGVTGLYDTAELFSVPEYASVAPGATYTFTVSFVMPNNDVRVWVFSHYWTGTDWYQDDQDYIDIDLVVGWTKLATQVITITPEVPEVAEWVKLASKIITITPTPEEWTMLATRTITITPEEVPVERWVKLASKVIALTPTEVPPPLCETDADCPPGYICQNGVCVKEIPPEEEKKFPWVPVIVGAGGIIAVIGIVAAAKKKGIK